MRNSCNVSIARISAKEAVYGRDWTSNNVITIDWATYLMLVNNNDHFIIIFRFVCLVDLWVLILSSADDMIRHVLSCLLLNLTCHGSLRLFLNSCADGRNTIV